MMYLLKFFLLVAYLSLSVRSQEVNLAHSLAHRQFFTTISQACVGSSCPKTSSTSTSIKSTSSPSSSSIFTSSTKTSASSVLPTLSSSAVTSRISTVPSTTSATASQIYDPYRLTTTFTQPPECTGGFTAIEDWGTQIYNNLIYSQKGFDLEYASCFPPQFYSSVLASIASTTMGAFSALVCPYTWENYEYNSTYVVCCPRGYNVITPNYEDTDRPGEGAVCSSYIEAGALMDVTTFDLTGGQTFLPTTAGFDGTVVWANGFDGITLGAMALSPTSISTTMVFSSSTTLPPKTTSTTSSASTSISVPSTIKTILSLTSSSLSSASNTVSSLSSIFLSTTSKSSTSLTSSSLSTSKPISSTISSTLVKTTSSVPSTLSTSSVRVTTTGTAIPGASSLPACGQLCFNNMLAQYSTLGCSPLDAYCLCNNVNFGFGLRDCSNGACGTDVASTVIAFGSAYCSTATATHTAVSTAIPGESSLPACGQLCFNNMLAQYSTLGCSPLDAYCLCNNVNFGFGLRDCSNGACGTDVASTVIAFGSAYCSTATATHQAQAPLKTA